MRCIDFRLAAEDRPLETAALSPILTTHLAQCPACTRWSLERNAWGNLGEIFRAEPEAIDVLALRQRVRTAAAGRRPAIPRWGWPAAAALAAALMIAVVLPAALRPAGQGASQVPVPPQAAPEPTSAPPAFGTVPAVVTARVGSSAPRRHGSRLLKPQAQSEMVRIVREDGRFAVEWPEEPAAAHQTHRVLTSTDPQNVRNGQEIMVAGNRWVDSVTELSAGQVQFYLID